MAEESDHVQAQALCDALRVPITVVYLDSHERGSTGGGAGGSTECEVHRFEPSDEGAGTIAAAAAGSGGGGAGTGRGRPSVHLLYRPGHYDIACELGWGLLQPLRAGGACLTHAASCRRDIGRGLTPWVATAECSLKMLGRVVSCTLQLSPLQTNAPADPKLVA